MNGTVGSWLLLFGLSLLCSIVIYHDEASCHEHDYIVNKATTFFIQSSCLVNYLLWLTADTADD